MVRAGSFPNEGKHSASIIRRWVMWARAVYDPRVRSARENRDEHGGDLGRGPSDEGHREDEADRLALAAAADVSPINAAVAIELVAARSHLAPNPVHFDRESHLAKSEMSRNLQAGASCEDLQRDRSSADDTRDSRRRQREVDRLGAHLPAEVTRKPAQVKSIALDVLARYVEVRRSVAEAEDERRARSSRQNPVIDRGLRHRSSAWRGPPCRELDGR